MHSISTKSKRCIKTQFLNLKVMKSEHQILFNFNLMDYLVEVVVELQVCHLDALYLVCHLHLHLLLLCHKIYAQSKQPESQLKVIIFFTEITAD